MIAKKSTRHARLRLKRQSLDQEAAQRLTPSVTHPPQVKTPPALLTSGAVQRLQRTVGNRAVNKLLQPAEAPPVQKSTEGPKVQRMIWIYEGGGSWEKERKDVIAPGAADTNHSVNPPNLPVRPAYNVGDSYDDAAAVPTIYSGTNARTLGEPGRFSGYGQISPAEDAMFRKGLAVGKLKLANSLAAVQAGVLAARSGPIDAHLAEVLEVAFNMPTNLARVEQLRILEILEAGLTRLQTGINADELPLISAARMYAYGFAKPADCSGWVPRGITETGGQGTPVASADDLQPVSGEIHMRTNGLASPSFVGDTIIHEGSHKFLGTWDYSYVGVQGSVGRGLNDRAAALQAADAALTAPAARAQAKLNSRNKAFGQVIQAIVAEGLKTHLPTPMDRGRDIQPADSDPVKEAKRTWAIVRQWTQNPPNDLLRQAAIDLLVAKDNLPGSAKTELAKCKTDEVQYLAENGNGLNVKGHDVLFALPTNFLLKNADSWTELALTAAG